MAILHVGLVVEEVPNVQPMELASSLEEALESAGVECDVVSLVSDGEVLMDFESFATDCVLSS